MKVTGFLLLLPLFTFSVLSVSAQKKIAGIVKDGHSDERVPFASVRFKNSNIGGSTDSSGAFFFRLSNWPSDTLEISCVGYQPRRIAIDKSKDTAFLNILLERGTFNEGVRVKIKINKGLLVWRKIVQNKPKNNRYRFTNFSYELYNKLEVDIKNINFKSLAKLKPFKPVEGIINENIDSTESAKYLPTYLTEVLSDYYYQKSPLRRREVIKAVNTNGVRNESSLKFLGGMDQVVNVYNNFIPVMDRQFISPASDNGDIYYNYNVTDTQVMGSNRYYHLVFTPRHAGTNTFEGDCWVHAGTFAIQKMNLRLGRSANVNFLETLSLIQEYSLINDSVWFLAKDKFVADLSPIGRDKPGFIGRKTTTYQNVVVNDSSVTKELDKNKKMEEIITLPDAGLKDKAFWEEERHEELTKSEKGIIRMIDTLVNDRGFQKFTERVYFLATGYKNVGNFEIGPWYNWITSNSWEGFRMRFDLGTNKHFDKKWWWHTYLAYGFGDKKLKGQVELFYLPKKDPRLYFHGSYTNDLDFGQKYYGEVTQDNIFALALRKNNVPAKYIKLNEKKFEIFRDSRSGLSTTLGFAHKIYTPLKNLISKDSFVATASGGPMTTAEVSIRLRFAYLEKFLETTFNRFSLGSPYPITELTLTKGIPGIFNSSYSYFKVSGGISDYIKVPPYGFINYLVYGGKTFGTLPYVFLNIAPGNELYYYNKYAFNLMNRYEFLHDQFAGINFEHNIGNGIFRLFPKLRLRQFWTVKTLWGSLSDANKELNFKKGNTFKTLDGKTYLEIGTGIDNIFRVIRIDFIWRLLPSVKPADRTPTDQHFGVFGSFRLSF